MKTPTILFLSSMRKGLKLSAAMAFEHSLKCLKFASSQYHSRLFATQTYPNKLNRFVKPRILFRTQDLSQVKDYCIQEWNKILGGKVTVEDFVFAKEVRLGTYR